MEKTNHCGVCERQKPRGIYIYQMYICEDCEKEVISTEPGDVRYSYFLKKLKSINQSTIHS
ncbi:sigma factor G inhibitor Gin [Thalassobacillus pellis]|uniref:sigma factor G inhibitor Gin n=1 Tax=Thalassobacillus pellis TaxID=748008 RepID=UPI00196200BD|nr:sigma factor G inhibitor Gin [Thalassobacillus pellis]MBM7555155.1 hypothetical protein [Thalassobacillus pellis]